MFMGAVGNRGRRRFLVPGSIVKPTNYLIKRTKEMKTEDSNEINNLLEDYKIRSLLRSARGYAVTQLVEALATNLNVAGSIPDGVTGMFD
jgi:phosphopantothenate synthetase